MPVQFYGHFEIYHLCTYLMPPDPPVGVETMFTFLYGLKCPWYTSSLQPLKCGTHPSSSSSIPSSPPTRPGHWIWLALACHGARVGEGKGGVQLRPWRRTRAQIPLTPCHGGGDGMGPHRWRSGAWLPAMGMGCGARIRDSGERGVEAGQVLAAWICSPMLPEGNRRPPRRSGVAAPQETTPMEVAPSTPTEIVAMDGGTCPNSTNPVTWRRRDRPLPLER